MTTAKRSEYDVQAEDFSKRFGLAVERLRHPFNACPTWTDTPHVETGKGDHIHGDRFVVKISRTNGNSVEFDFWGSYADKQAGRFPTAYDVLASISGDVSIADAGWRTTADEVYAEFGPMKPSQAQAIADHARKLQAFFTAAEREALAEIQ